MEAGHVNRQRKWTTSGTKDNGHLGFAPAPDLGEQNYQIYSELLRYSDQEINGLKTKGSI